MNQHHDALQLQAALDAEQRVRNFLYFDGNKNRDFPSMKVFVDTLTEAQEDELQTLLQDQADRQRALIIAPQYVEFLNEVHELAVKGLLQSAQVQEKLALWKKIIPDFIDMEIGERKDGKKGIGYFYTSPEKLCTLTSKGRAHLDQAGLTYDVQLHLMRLAAKEVHKAWQSILGESGELSVTEVRPCALNEKHPKEEFNHQFDVVDNQIRPYYHVGRWSHSMADPRSLFDIAVHEPEHSFQERIRGFEFHNIPEKYHVSFGYMKAAFQKLNGLCPMWVVSGAKSEKVKALFLECYYTCPRESTAFYQGLMMAMALSDRLGIPVPSFSKAWFAQRPFLAERLPKSIKKMLPEAERPKEASNSYLGVQQRELA